MDGVRIIVGIYYNESASCLVSCPKPRFNEIHNSSSYSLAEIILISAQASYQDCREAAQIFFCQMGIFKEMFFIFVVEFFY